MRITNVVRSGKTDAAEKIVVVDTGSGWEYTAGKEDGELRITIDKVTGDLKKDIRHALRVFGRQRTSFFSLGGLSDMATLKRLGEELRRGRVTIARKQQVRG